MATTTENDTPASFAYNHVNDFRIVSDDEDTRLPVFGSEVGGLGGKIFRDGYRCDDIVSSYLVVPWPHGVELDLLLIDDEKRNRPLTVFFTVLRK